MTRKIIITEAYNGIMMEVEGRSQVIENAHADDDEDKDNIIRELGKWFHGEIMYAMEIEMSGKIKVNIEISKAE